MRTPEENVYKFIQHLFAPCNRRPKTPLLCVARSQVVGVPQVQRTTDLTGERDSGDLFRGACTTLEDQPVRVFDTAPVGYP